MEKPPVQLSKLWCSHCANYTRHRREAGSATCLACGHKHVLLFPSTSRGTDAPRPSASALMWRKPRSPEMEKNYRLALSEARRLLETTRQLNGFLKQNDIIVKPLPDSQIQRLIGELDRLLEE
jgi:hypothetical protein